MSEINIAACRARQKRVVELMEKLKLDVVIVSKHEHVQYLAGPRFAWTHEPAAALWADGTLALVAPNEIPPVAAADEVATYEAQWRCTLRNDQRQASSDVLWKVLETKKQPQRIGVEFSCFSHHLSNRFDAKKLVDIEPSLFRLRRRKDEDELVRLRLAIAATGKMYEHARSILEPGINELEVFNQLQAVAVTELGEMLTGTGNDYRSGEPGGPPRNRKAEDGELYILDLGPAYQGYFADNCRTFAVNDQPTDAQCKAWEHLMPVFDMVAEHVRPGKSCKEFFELVKKYLDEYKPGAFFHHLGHGIGLFPHETPHLNSDWDDTFEIGDVFTCEPGLYTPELRAGIRLENDYLVTPKGVELLSPFPMHL